MRMSPILLLAACTAIQGESLENVLANPDTPMVPENTECVDTDIDIESYLTECPKTLVQYITPEDLDTTCDAALRSVGYWRVRLAEYPDNPWYQAFLDRNVAIAEHVCTRR